MQFHCFPALKPLLPPRTNILSCWLCFPLPGEHGGSQKNLHRLLTHLPTFSVWTFWHCPPDTGGTSCTSIWGQSLPSLDPISLSPTQSNPSFPLFQDLFLHPWISIPISIQIALIFLILKLSRPTFPINCCHIVLCSHSQQTSEELTILTNSSPPSFFL